MHSWAYTGHRLHPPADASTIGPHIVNKRIDGLAIVACMGFNSPALAVSADSSARIIALDAKTWAGSSVNVLANVRQPLSTEGAIQYAGYYAANGCRKI